MTGLSGLTDGSLVGGVYRVDDDLETITAAVRDAGWSAAVAGPAGTTAELYEQLVAALRLPGWFGRNLDALWDVLTDLDRPTAVILADWHRYARARPERWGMILDVLTERGRLTPPFAVVLASAAPAEETP